MSLAPGTARNGWIAVVDLRHGRGGTHALMLAPEQLSRITIAEARA